MVVDLGGTAPAFLINGTDSPDTIVAGSAGMALGDDGDVDVTSIGTAPSWKLFGNGGDDVIGVGGGHGSGAPLGSDGNLLDGGLGDDRDRRRQAATTVLVVDGGRASDDVLRRAAARTPSSRSSHGTRLRRRALFGGDGNDSFERGPGDGRRDRRRHRRARRRRRPRTVTGVENVSH